MADKQWLRDTQIEPGTGADVYDLAPEQGDPAGSVAGSNDTTTFVEVLRFQRVASGGIAPTTAPTSVNITDLTDDLLWNPEVRWRLQRLDATGQAQESSAYSPVVGATGVHTADLTLDTKWDSGDLLALSVEARRDGGLTGTVTATVATQDADSFVDAKVVKQPKGSIRRPVRTRRVSVEALFWTRITVTMTAYVVEDRAVPVDLAVDTRQRVYPRARAATPVHVAARSASTVAAHTAADATPQVRCTPAAHAPTRLTAAASAATAAQVRSDSPTQVATRSATTAAAHVRASATADVRTRSTAVLDDIDGLLAALT